MGKEPAPALPSSAFSLLALAERAIARAAQADAAIEAASLRRLKTSVRELVPANGPLITRRPPTPAHLCEDVTSEVMHDPPPERSALAEYRARAGLADRRVI